jgi:hypothetical protein
MTWFKGQAAEFYDSGIQKLVPRLNKCLDNTGDCVEKSPAYEDGTDRAFRNVGQ